MKFLKTIAVLNLIAGLANLGLFFFVPPAPLINLFVGIANVSVFIYFYFNNKKIC